MASLYTDGSINQIRKKSVDFFSLWNTNVYQSIQYYIDRLSKIVKLW